MNNISRSWPSDAAGRVPYWVYSDPDVYAAELERIWYGPHWLFCAPRSRNPRCRRLQDHHTRRTSGHRRPQRAGRGQRAGKPLRPSRRKILPGSQGSCEGSALPLPPMELQPARRPAGRRVPPRRARPGRHARRFRSEDHQPAQAARGGGQRRGLGDIFRRHAAVSATISGSASGSTTPASTTGGNWRSWATIASTFPATGS